MRIDYELRPMGQQPAKLRALELGCYGGAEGAEGYGSGTNALRGIAKYIGGIEFSRALRQLDEASENEEWEAVDSICEFLLDTLNAYFDAIGRPAFFEWDGGELFLKPWEEGMEAPLY